MGAYPTCQPECGVAHTDFCRLQRFVEERNRMRVEWEEMSDMVDYITKNALGGWAGRTVEEMEKFRERRASGKRVKLTETAREPSGDRQPALRTLPATPPPQT